MQAPDLKQYWYKLLAGLLSTLTSRKFWIMLGADLAAYQQLLERAITPDAFLLVVVSGAVAFIGATVYEDGQTKSAAAKSAGRFQRPD